MSRPDEVLDAVRSDVCRIRDEQRWCFFDGFQPKGANPDRVAGVHTQDVFGRDIEAIQSEPVRRDIGVGDARSRRAFLESAWLITFLDLQLVATLTKLGHTNQPPFLVVSTTSSLQDRDDVLVMASTRVELIAEVWESAPRRWQSKARKPLGAPHKGPALLTPRKDPSESVPSARAAADEAVRILSRALSRGDTGGIATAEPYCWVCKIRPASAKKGGRCSTCDSWKCRNGAERPAKLDEEEMAAPLAAAARRRARDEGWGAS